MVTPIYWFDTDDIPQYWSAWDTSATSVRNTIYQDFVRGEWETDWIKGKRKLTIDPMDDINDTGALDNFLKEFKIQPQII